MLKRRNILEKSVSLLALAFIFNSKKAMLANLIGGFVTIMVGVSLMGPIAQEINNIATCQISDTNISDTIDLSSSEPKGSTDSFGGGGSNHFGGYDNKVQHNGFIEAIASTSMIKTNKSVLNPDCTPITGAAASALKMVPIFFTIAVIGIGLAMAYTSLSSAGLFDNIKFKKKKKKKNESEI